MIVLVNNKPVETETETIAAVLQRIQILEFKGIAVAVNNTVIPKNEWDSFRIQENDRITVIRATQGG